MKKYNIHNVVGTKFRYSTTVYEVIQSPTKEDRVDLLYSGNGRIRDQYTKTEVVDHYNKGSWVVLEEASVLLENYQIY